jgi:tetratricopeptide (TPR) repeat protein/predicted aspartyl protease
VKTVGLSILVCSMIGVSLPAASLAESKCVVVKADLPITIAPGNRAMLSTKINGQDAPFILDSGAFFSMMPMAAAAQYHLPLRWAPMGMTVTGIGGDSRVQIGIVKELLIGKTKFKNAEFLIGGTDIQSNSVGLIGQNLLASWDVEYDMGHGKVALLELRDCRKAWVAYWTPAGRASELDIEPAKESLYHTVGMVQINGKDIKFTFDTGAPTSILFRRGADKLGIKLDGPGVAEAGYSGGLGANRVKQYIVTLGSFKLGELVETKNSRIRVIDGNMGPNVYSKYDSDMLLGADFMLAHRILVSNSQHKMYVTYNGGPVFNVNGPRPNLAGAQPADEPAPTDGSPAAPPAESLSALEFSRRGNASAARRDYDSAIADLTKACALEPNNPEYFYQRALIYYQAGKADLALLDFDQVLKLKADFLPAYAPRARLRLAKHQTDDALADLDAADRLSPKEAHLRFELSELYGEMRRYPAAIAQLDLWLKSHDEDSNTGTAFGNRCRFKVYLNENVQSALDDCSRAIRLEDKKEPRYATALSNRGLAYVRQGKFDRATEDFDAAIKLQPKLAASAYYGRGLVEARQNKQLQSNIDLADARKLSPKIDEFYEPLGLKP